MMLIRTSPNGIPKMEDRGSSNAMTARRIVVSLQLLSLDIERDHEAVWALNNEGVIQFTCQCADLIGGSTARLWSLVDLFINLNGSLRVAHEMWNTLGYFGDGDFLVK
jgi:hypothetical protein